ncbi:ABC transporter family substrate-binding protein [Streptomyces sp. XM83C]|uniref:ABC transporter family substrate-binding protein n=1 Tax=Streptomyces thermocoprophilus TaxID=78356 RepID=A0ABV5VNE5_9ACTN|nr:ABC transporter family substrate-binding protein [Streptomyces sp. XM83C]MCK1821442.1 ABC transporter family substrate-binding protein [Streptomyces sp. XM83C]
MSHVGVGPRAVVRSAAFLTAGALAVTVLTGCGGEDEAGRPLAGQDIAQAARGKIADGGTLRWAVDAVPDTLNTFQADADAATTTVAQATLPSMYTLDELGRPQRNADYLESAKVVETEPKQVVLYKLNQQAVWSDGREIGAADFAAQWRALSGKDSAYWTARNAGYDRIEKVERGDNDLEVKVTFSRPYADWRSLFSPLYPKEVMGTPDSFNDGARRKLKVTAGPFNVKQVDVKAKDVVLTRNPRWWGEPAKLEKIVLHAVPRDKRVDALAEGAVDLAPVDAVDARRITGAARGNAGPLAGPGRSETEVLRDWGAAHGFDEDAVDSESGLKKVRKAMAEWHMRESMLRGFEVRKSFEPAYTQLALNGSEGPLADERVRRAVARALDRKALAELVLKPLGLPAVPVGSHLALSGQAAYADNSGALGDHDTGEAQALLADAGWVPGGPVEEPKKGEKAEKAAGGEAEKSEKKDEKKDEEKAGKKGDKAAGGSGADGDNRGGASASEGDDGTYIVGQDGKARRGPDTVEDGAARTGGAARDGQDEKPNGRHGEDGTRQLAQDGLRGGAPGAYAPKGTAAPAGAAPKVLAKDGKALSLKFVVPSGPGSETLRTVADRIARMLEKVGIRTEITKVDDNSYFKDHIASGQYDLALYSWPATAYPATDARPIYAKPVPAADGSLTVEQNYTRVGTDQVDQLFEQAIGTLDEDEARDLIRKADSRIWAAAGSIPLYQRPQLVAARKNLVNAGAFGFRTPVFQDMGFLKKGEKLSPSPSKS